MSDDLGLEATEAAEDAIAEALDVADEAPAHLDREPELDADDQDAAANALVAAEIPDYDEGEAASALAEILVEDLDGATWAARKHNVLDQRRRAIKKYRDDAKAELDRWFSRETERLDADMRFFAGRLEGFHRRMLDLDPRNAITVRLPNGTELASQAGKLAVEVTDVDALAVWAETNEVGEEIIRYGKPEPQKTEIGKRYGAKATAETEPGEYEAFDPITGEAIPGVKIVRRPRTYTIRGPI